MLKFGNKEFRNLQEQVLKNMQDIQDIMQGTAVLDEFGIKVVGQVASVPDMPTVEQYKEDNPDWAYGDAYAIGEDSPYTLKILTRGSNGGADYWFNIGEFPAPGPKGDTGPQGPVGPQGPTGPSGSDGADAGFGTISATAQTLVPGSSATASVVASGPDSAKNFAFTFGIPQGIQGPQGETGPQGPEGPEGPEGPQGPAGQDGADGRDGLTTDISVNGNTYTQVSGTITLPNYPDISNMATINTEQTFSAKKTFANPVEFTTSDVTFGNGTVTTIPGTIRTDKTNSYGVNIPSTSSFAANKTLATTDQIPSVNYPVTDVEVDGVSVLSGTVAEITMPDLSDYITSTELSTELADYTPTANLSTVATSGDYDDLLDKPDLSVYAESADLGDCAYLDEDELSIAYSQITGTPTIPTNTSDLNNDSGFITSSALSGYATETWVGNQGYAVASNLASVATSGSYNDLSNTPTIPAAQVNSDWDAASGVAQILNKPTIPTDTSDLTNGAGFITSSALTDYVTKDSAQDISGQKTFTTPLYVATNNGIMARNGSGWLAEYYPVITPAVNGATYRITIGGLSSGVSASDCEIYMNAPIIAAQGFKTISGYTISVPLIGANETLATEEYVTAQGYLTSVSWSDVSNKPSFATVATSGDYDDLLNKPSIPTSLPVETLTTEPSAAYTGPGLKIVYLSAEPTTKYAGYIYMIAES